MKTQSSFNKGELLSQIDCDMLKRSFVIAVITEFDATLSLNVATELTTQLKQAGKVTHLLDLNNQNSQSEHVVPQVLVVNCIAGVHQANIDVANYADIIIIAPSINNIADAVAGCFQVISDLIKQSSYKHKYKMLITNAPDHPSGIELYQGVSNVIDRFHTVLTDLIGIVTTNMTQGEKNSVYKKSVALILECLYKSPRH